jgi:hypothetical protein
LHCILEQEPLKALRVFGLTYCFGLGCVLLKGDLCENVLNSKCFDRGVFGRGRNTLKLELKKDRGGSGGKDRDIYRYKRHEVSLTHLLILVIQFWKREWD